MFATWRKGQGRGDTEESCLDKGTECGLACWRDHRETSVTRKEQEKARVRGEVGEEAVRWHCASEGSQGAVLCWGALVCTAHARGGVTTGGDGPWRAGIIPYSHHPPCPFCISNNREHFH